MFISFLLKKNKVVSELGVFQAPWYKEPKYLLDSWEGKDDDQMVDEDRVQLLQYNADSGDINSQVMLGMLHLQGLLEKKEWENSYEKRKFCF